SEQPRERRLRSRQRGVAIVAEQRRGQDAQWRIRVSGDLFQNRDGGIAHSIGPQEALTPGELVEETHAVQTAKRSDRGSGQMQLVNGVLTSGGQESGGRAARSRGIASSERLLGLDLEEPSYKVDPRQLQGDASDCGRCNSEIFASAYCTDFESVGRHV